MKKKESKGTGEGRKERAERSVRSLHQSSSFTRPWPILARLELLFLCWKKFDANTAVHRWK